MSSSSSGNRASVMHDVDISLRVPEARVLSTLMPSSLKDPQFDWPVINRTQLGLRSGFTVLSGSCTRALNGIRQGNKTSGKPHLGLIDRGLVEQVVMDVEGIEEINYRITALGVLAFQTYVKSGGSFPPIKDAAMHTNDRYIDVGEEEDKSNSDDNKREG